MDYEAVIGLEVHIQLLTESKIFCGCSASFGAAPNTHVCPVCLGMPGVLPVLNRKAVEFALRMGLAVGGQVNPRAIFARKNYFYPDLPKGYQISQYEEPLILGGQVEIEVEGRIKPIRLVRIHLEEDAGKSVHAEDYVGANETLVDANRCGIPLIEVVSEPDLASPREAALYLSRLRQLVQYLRISSGNMEEGSLRCDANVSVRPAGSVRLGVKTELKNMNSIRGVERALAFEIRRQIAILQQGGRIEPETLLWDEKRGVAEPMRAKETAPDYRYFPEPDLVPLQIDSAWIEEIRAGLPELPLARKRRLVEQYALPEYDAEILTETRELADYFEAAAQATPHVKKLSNWVMGEVLRVLNERNLALEQFPVAPENLAKLVNLVEEGEISASAAKRVFDEMVQSGEPPEAIVRRRGLRQISDARELEEVVDRVLQAHPGEVQRFRQGKDKLLTFFVGQVMQATGGKANPRLVNELLREKLGGSKG
ncbi:MAG: Asp-tRNA(Asn)/Glu-tRNA(Gln) amidotransferase subunit GatB [candidate division KSB1 bacterium]|nr:Asp-tRNA(Asn)/Glu-tRNA(Gln) amidotransferase subunit GatB [candidate division KSB1 bacterium]